VKIFWLIKVGVENAILKSGEENVLFHISLSEKSAIRRYKVSGFPGGSWLVGVLLLGLHVYQTAHKPIRRQSNNSEMLDGHCFQLPFIMCL